ncbi:MAG: thioredoxin domain-containing protein, partial [Halioglobus sp.]|nr:thioredoxin domain-containing protein [Halioglobus sp.]
EKMLYDNGPLLAIYAQAALATGETEFRDVANETADWMLRRMRAPDGGFYASLDADSEGEEGRYYVWTPGEVEALLPEDHYPAFAGYYGLDKDANFEGHWHLSVQQDRNELAASLDCTQTALLESLQRSRDILLAHRQQRTPPARDDKQLSSWNALAIRGLAIAGRALQRPDLIAAAQEASDFVRGKLLLDGRLMASYKDGRARFPAYLDDHAFMLDALLELLQSNWRSGDLQFAIEIADLLLEHFYDPDKGGFWFTANDHEKLMLRQKPIADEALPAGAGVAAFALQRLGFLLGETRYLDAAGKTLMYAWPALEQHPEGHVSLLAALEEYLYHREIVVIRGAPDKIREWRDAAARIYAPRRQVYAIAAEVSGLPGALALRKADRNRTLAYCCEGTSCSLPLESWEALAGVLRGN